VGKGKFGWEIRPGGKGMLSRPWSKGVYRNNKLERLFLKSRRCTMTVVNNVFFAAPDYGKNPRKRITATELIDGVRCIITLERDKSGHYREVRLDPLHKVREEEKQVLQSGN
jgi:hypothetical protein